MKHQNEDFRVRYNVSSTKKRNLGLDTTYQALKREFFMLPRGAERPKRDFSCFRATRKGQKEIFRASAWRGKAKKRIFVLLRGAERPKREFSCFCVARKDQKRGFRCYSAARKDQKENLGVTAWRGKTKWRF